jgi:hypothetical protein
VCGTKNFASVRLYSAPQLHRTIVAILGICACGTPKQVETRRHNQTDPLPAFVSVSRCEFGRPRVQKGMRDGLTKVSAVTLPT